MSQVEWLAAAAPSRYPSAPVWNQTEARLYWSDIDACKLFRLDPASGEVETVLDDGRPVGAIVVQADASLLLFRENGCVESFRDGAVTDAVVPPISDLRRTRFACAVADPAGCVICATLSSPKHPARLYLLDRNGRLSLLRETIGTPSGLSFTADGRTLLLSNSHAIRPETLRFDYGASPLAAAPFFSCLDEAPRQRGVPGGIAPVADGSVIIARIGGAAAIRHVPTGERLYTYAIPVKRPIGLCFGGPEMRDLFITTAGAHRIFLDGAHAGEIAFLPGQKFQGAIPFPARIGLSDDAAPPPPPPPPEPVSVPEAPDNPSGANPSAGPSDYQSVAPSVDPSAANPSATPSNDPSSANQSAAPSAPTA